MAMCWEDYLARVHNAIATEPWNNNVQLLDIFISTAPSSLSGWWPCSRSAGSSDEAVPRWNQLHRAGSMLNLRGTKEVSDDWSKVAAELRCLMEKAISAADAAAPLLPSSTTSTTMASTGSKPAAGPDALFRLDSMPDIRVSVKRSGALARVLKVASGDGISASDSISMNGSRSVKFTISGVKLQRVPVDAVMDLVTAPSPSRPASWKPNPFRGELRWSFKRGQTLWVVIEVLYASKISMHIDDMKELKANAKVPSINTNVGTIGVNASNNAKLGVDELFSISASKDKLFPFAFRVKQLNYDGQGILKSSQVVLKKSKSLRAIIKQASVRTVSDHINHHHSLSFSSV